MTSIYQQTFGSGKPIVLIHGWAMHSGIWRRFAENLAQHYQVTCVDLPGHGRSGKLDSFTLEHISAALADAVQAQNACWLGWSLGASVVLDLARRFPERINALILLAGNPHFTETMDWHGVDVQLLNTFAENLHNDCQATLLRFLALQVNGLADAKALLKELKAAVFECPPPDGGTLQSGLAILKQADLRPALAETNKPVSLILGNRDTLVPVAAARQMQALCPDMELAIIDRAGHVPFLSHQQELLAIISRFMSHS